MLGIGLSDDLLWRRLKGTAERRRRKGEDLSSTHSFDLVLYSEDIYIFKANNN